MSNPSFENIDRWLFEYTEGNLTPAQMEQLESFVFLHFELNIDLDAWKSARVEKDNVAFDVLAYQQAAPLFGMLWTSAAVGFLLFAISYFVSPDSFAIASKYLPQRIDVAIVDQTLAEDALFATNRITNESSDEVTSNANTIRIAKNQISAAPAAPSQYRNANTLSGKNQDITVATIISENDAAETSELASSNRTSPYLADVVASLTNTVEEEDLLAEETGQEKRAYSYQERNRTLKKRFSNMGRQIKRMADQPVALRNSKDPHFHAPFMTGYNANFGMVGTLMRNRFQATTRNQWVGHENQQLMNTISWDNYIYELRGGLGVDVNYSSYADGGIENYSAAITYSPKFSLSKNVSFEPALRFKTGMINLDNDSPIIGRDIELRRRQLQGVFTDGAAPIGSQLWYRDAGVGMLLNTKWFYAGVNMDNVNRHYNNFHSSDINADHRADHHFTSIIGSEYTPLGRNLTYSAYALYQKFGDLNELWIGGNVQWNWMQIGAGVSHNSDFGGSIGIKLDQFTIMYNIDYLESSMLDANLLSHQVTMRILMQPNRFAAKYLLK